MHRLLQSGEWLCVYLLQWLAYLKQSTVPAVVKQPPCPADKRWRIFQLWNNYHCWPWCISSATTSQFTGRNTERMGVNWCYQQQVAHLLLLISSGNVYKQSYTCSENYQIDQFTTFLCCLLSFVCVKPYQSAYLPLLLRMHSLHVSSEQGRRPLSFIILQPTTVHVRNIHTFPFVC